MLSAAVNGQLKIGFVEYNRIIQKVPYCQGELKQIDSVERLYRDSLETLVSYYTNIVNGIPCNQKMDSIQRDLERELKQMLTKLENCQHVAQIRVAATRERVQHEMVDKLSGLLWLFCASNNIVSIAEKNKIFILFRL